MLQNIRQFCLPEHNQENNSRFCLKISLYAFPVRLVFQELCFRYSYFPGFLTFFHFRLLQVSILFLTHSYLSLVSPLIYWRLRTHSLIAVFRYSIGCNFSGLQANLITGCSSAISSCHPWLCIPVSVLARPCVQHSKSAQNKPYSKGKCFLLIRHSASAQLELAQEGLMEGGGHPGRQN